MFNAYINNGLLLAIEVDKLIIIHDICLCDINLHILVYVVLVFV